jgi:hypothetical protein
VGRLGGGGLGGRARHQGRGPARRPSDGHLRPAGIVLGRADGPMTDRWRPGAVVGRVQSLRRLRSDWWFRLGRVRGRFRPGWDPRGRIAGRLSAERRIPEQRTRIRDRTGRAVCRSRRTDRSAGRSARRPPIPRAAVKAGPRGRRAPGRSGRTPGGGGPVVGGPTFGGPTFGGPTFGEPTDGGPVACETSRPPATRSRSPRRSEPAPRRPTTPNRSEQWRPPLITPGRWWARCSAEHGAGGRCPRRRGCPGCSAGGG